MKKLFTLLFMISFVSVINAQPQKKYVDLSNGVVNTWASPKWGQPLFWDEFDSLSVRNLWGADTAHLHDTDYFVLNNKWLWSWDTYLLNAGDPFYYRFGNIYFNDTNHVSGTPSTNKYLRLYDKNQDVNLRSNPMYPVIKSYSSSMLLSADKKYYGTTLHHGQFFRYGYFEIRCKLPATRYAWPAFWLMGPNENPSPENPAGWNEIDCFEHGSNDAIVHTNIWRDHADNKPYLNQKYSYALPGQTFGGTWVTYAIKWEPNKIIWYINNVPVKISRNIDKDGLGQSNVIIPSNKMYIVANNGMNMDWVRYDMEQSAVYPNAMDIDYIRVYQRTDSANYISKADPVFSINGLSCGADSASPVYMAAEKIILDASQSYMPNHRYRIIIKSFNSAILADVKITDGGLYNGSPVDISNFDLSRIYNGFSDGSYYKITVRDTGNCNMPECIKTQLIRKVWGSPLFSLNGKQNIGNTHVVIPYNNGKPSIILDVTQARSSFNCTSVTLGYFDGLVGDYTTGMQYYNVPITGNYLELSTFLKDNHIYADSSNGGFYTVGLTNYVSSESPNITFTIAPVVPHFNVILNSLTSGLLKSHQKTVDSSYTVSAGDDIILSKGTGPIGDTATVYTVRVSGNGNAYISHTFHLLTYYSVPMNYEYNDNYNGESYSIGNFNIRSFCKTNNYLLEPGIVYTVSLSVGGYTASNTFVIQQQADYPSKFMIYSYGDWCASAFPTQHRDLLTDDNLKLFSPDFNASYPDSIISTSVDRSYTLKIENLIESKKDSFELSNSEIYQLKILGTLDLKNSRFNNIIKLDANNEFIANTYRITLKNYTSATPNNSLYRKETSQVITIYPKNRIVSNGTLEINSNKTIEPSEIFYLSSNLKVKAGKTLTVKGNLQFNKNCKLIVEIGAKLIIDGGKLSSNKFYYPVTCPWHWPDDVAVTWLGVEVWGNNVSRQLQSNQGYIKIRTNGTNKGTIENADIAIVTIDNITGVASTGGILDIDGASFINNKNSILMLYFHNYTATGLLINNVSKIRNSYFQADSSMHNLGDFISLIEVEGIEISGNTFSYNNPANANETQGIGIECTNASCYITENLSGIENTFLKLNYGIKIHNSVSTKSVTIRNNKFQKNQHGIDIRNSNNSIITSNNFWIANSLTTQPNNTGVYMLYCSGYKFENNTFYSQDRKAIGAVIYDGTNTANYVYKNNFFNLFIGTQVESPLQAQSNTGLFVKCNKYYATIKQADIAFTSGRVASPQGTCDNTDHKSSAGDSLKSIGHNTIFKSIWSNYPYSSCSPFVYNTQSNMMPASWSNGVTPNPCSYTYSPADCPSTLSGSGTGISTGALVARISSLNTQITTQTAKIDGGSTQTMLNKVNSNLSAGNLKNVLLAAGPYLSDTVLVATIKKSNPLPPGTLKEIIIPNSPVTGKVMNALNTANLPKGINQEIQVAQVGVSSRTILEQQIVTLQQQKDIATAELMRKYSNDTIIKIDSTILFLKSQPDVNSKKQLAQAYLIKQDCANATTTLNALPQQTQEDITFKQFYSIMVSLCTQGKTVFDLTALQKQTMYNIAGSNTSVSAAAQSVLTTVYKEFYPQIIDGLIVPDNQTIRGYLRNNSSCNNNPVINDTIIILDSVKQIVQLPLPVITDQQGFFKFNYNHLMLLDENAKYTFGTASGAVIQDTIFKTVQQWITASPVNLNLKKLKAGFVSDTVPELFILKIICTINQAILRQE